MGAVLELPPTPQKTLASTQQANIIELQHDTPLVAKAWRQDQGRVDPSQIQSGGGKLRQLAAQPLEDGLAAASRMVLCGLAEGSDLVDALIEHRRQPRRFARLVWSLQSA